MPQKFSVNRGGTRVVFGDDASKLVGAELKALGAQRTLVVCTARRKRDVLEAVGDHCVGLFAEAQPHVPEALVDRAHGVVSEHKADAVLAYGGGSTIGLAKALALRSDIVIGAIPTTYSGSEMTPIYGMTSGSGKTTGRDPRVLPNLVIYDPRLTYDLPFAVSCTSIFNSMAHAVEALYAQDADPVTLLAAERALRDLCGSIPRLLADARDPQGREDALVGAYLSGLALGSAAMGMHHKLCHVLGGSFGLSHAKTHTVLLPHVIAYNAAAAAGAIATMGQAMGMSDPAAGLYDLAARVGAPTDLATLGLQLSNLDAAADAAVQKQYANPRPVERDAVRDLLDNAYHGRRPSIS